MNLPGSKIPEERAAELCRQYRASLFDDVVPWWMEHSLDRELGGYHSLLERDGRRWADDKYVWMNGRQIWMLSHLYNACEANPDWLHAARLGAEFLIEHAFKEDGKMHFRLTREGQSRSEVLSLYTEVFGAMAMAEFAKASGERGRIAWRARQLALRVCRPRLLPCDRAALPLITRHRSDQPVPCP